MASSNEGAELKLISSIRYKLANVSSDEKKLSDALQTQLAPLLGKAGSQHKTVRDATFQAFISVSNFIKPAAVILPVAALLEQYKTASSPMVKQLDLNLIKQGLPRLSQPQRRGLLPVVLRGISRESSSASAAGFFNIFLRLLLEIQIPGRGTDDDLCLRETIGLADPEDARYVSRSLGKLFLLRQDLAFAADDELDKMLAVAPTGLEKGDIAFLRNNNPQTWRPGTPNSLSLPESKVKAVGFLASGAFMDEERHVPIICAAGSADSRISSVADDILKRSKVSLEDEAVVRSLFNAHSRFPAAQRMQILRLLSKSVIACTLRAQVVEAVRQDFKITSGEDAAVSGLEATRLHKTLLAFLAWIARNSSTAGSADHEMGPALVLILKDYILKQGWPEPASRGSQSQFQDDMKLRANAYETIGVLARGSSFEHKAKDSLLKWLFDSLVSDPSADIVVYIESALSSMMGLFKPSTPNESRDLELLLLEYMNMPERQGLRTARHVASRFANNCLPYHNVKARWIDILALSGNSSDRRDVFEEGKRGLDPWWANTLQPEKTLSLPDWTDMVATYFDTTPKELGSDDMAIDQTSKYSAFPNELLQAFPISVRFIKQTVLLSALGFDTFEVDWESRLETSIENDLSVRTKLRESLAHADQSSLLQLLNASLDGLRDHPDVGAEDAISCLADITSFAPVESIIRPLSSRTAELIPLLKSNNYKVRQLASRTFGIIAPWNGQSAAIISQLRSFIESCQVPTASQSAEYQGSLDCLGRYFSRAAFYGKISSEDAGEHVDFVYKCFMSSLKSTDTHIRDAAIDAMGHLWTAGMGFPIDGSEREEAIKSLTELGKANNERAIRALGKMAIPDPADVTGSNSDPVTKILDQLFSLSDTKRTEVHFATGEAIAAAVARWDSESIQLGLDVEPAGSGKTQITDKLRKRPSRITDALDKLITDCKTTKPSLLKASGIWLFCVIQFCSALPEIQQRLRECQVAFMRLLTGRDELVQETASRGLALVYERGDESLKGDLVKDLVGSFTGTKTQLKVDEDTELFDAGALPTGEGKSVTSYKDIISLANEVGDQSLIYKFMALATNAATWTARSAFGRFGLSNILSDAELDPKIYPKLFRYRFDPNSNVRRSMDDIWSAVVKDSKVVIDTHFDAIMDDLLKSILDGREWRVREASCAAIADLIFAQPFPVYEKYYTEIWRVTSRVLDDQKGSVRNAALKLSMGLSKTLVTKLQENNTSNSATAMIAQVLPFLLSEKGVENSVQEVQIMSIKTVLDVVKNGGEALKPFVTTIIIHFLGLLSTVEPEQVNFYYQRAGEADREELDKLRSTAATRSPLFECIADCLRFVDEEVMKEFAPQLNQTIKSALGMQTKVGCSEVLSTLALRHSILLPPHNPSFLKLMGTQILDRNHETSKAYARSAAYLLRTASTQTRARFTSKLTDLYFNAEDETRRQKVADAVLAIAKVSPDAFTDLESTLLPFSYLGKHDTDDYVSEEFGAVWSQHAGSSHTLKRFVDEIVEFSTRALDTSKWAIQHGGALAIASMITGLSSAVGKDGQFPDGNVQRIWPALEKALALKTFSGKGKLVTAYPLFVKHGKSLWVHDKTIAALTKKIAIREAKRNNNEYRPYALKALAKYTTAREDLDMYPEVVEICTEFLSPDTASHSLPEAERKTAEAALKAAMSAYNRPKMRENPGAVLAEVAAVVEKAIPAIAVAKDTWFGSAVDILKAAAKAGDKLTVSSGDSDSSSSAVLASRWFALLLTNEAEVALESERSSRAKALLALVDAQKKGAFGGKPEEQGTFQAEMAAKVTELKNNDRSLDVKKLLGSVLERLG